MTQLYARSKSRQDREPFVVRLTTDCGLHPALRSAEALLLEHPSAQDRSGFQAVFAKSHVAAAGQDAFSMPPELDYLGTGDIVKAVPRTGDIQVLYRRASLSNFLFLTERCNSKCLMCSQPPRDIEDGYRVQDALQAIPLMAPDTNALVLTGGETTLLHQDLLRLFRSAKAHLPDTRLNVLTNGRLLAYLRYAEQIADVGHHGLTLCIPLYADVDSLHDFVVQARGAFDQTVRGLLNCGRCGIKVELRVVLHNQNVARLPHLATFIARNLPFVSHVALMGLEMTGFTKANLNALWIDPAEYRHELEAAVETLDWAGLHVSIYNHQLCLLPRPLWPFARRSISDWKNVYMPQCHECAVRHECGGFFASASLRHSAHIRAVPTSSSLTGRHSVNVD